MKLTTTVAIATFNRPESLLKAIDSLDRQEVPPDEVLVVRWLDDVGTRDVLRSAGGRVTSRIRELATDSNSLTLKENQAIAEASGDIVCFLDDDAVADSDWLLRMLAHYADSSVGGVGGRDAGPTSGMRPARRNRAVGRLAWFGRLSGNHHEDNIGRRDVDFLKGCNMSYRRNLLGPIDHMLAGSTPYGYEIDVGLSIRARGYRLIYDPEVRVSHYPSGTMAADDPQLAWVVNHNQTYILLKWLSGPRRIAFIAYTFLVGDRNAIGAARIPLQCLPQRWALSSIWPHVRGKLDGIVTFLRVKCSAEDV
jgi:GT2 family glycosyltransferase